MSNNEFDIVFRGDIVIGHQLAEVKLKLQQLFKVDAAKVDSLFTGRPVPLKRNLDEATAHKYREVLLKAGAQVEVVPAGKFSGAPAAPVRPQTPPPPVAPVAPAAAPVAATRLPAAAKADWSLAPTGADLLEPAQRPQVAPVRVDTGHLSLRPLAGNLLDSSEVAPAPVAAVVAPALDLAEVGADLVRAEEKLQLPLVEIELEDWDIAPAGTDLLSDDERPLVVPVALANSDFDLAPAGSDLGQLKPRVQPVNPDTSALKLVDKG